MKLLRIMDLIISFCSYEDITQQITMEANNSNVEIKYPGVTYILGIKNVTYKNNEITHIIDDDKFVSLCRELRSLVLHNKYLYKKFTYCHTTNLFSYIDKNLNRVDLDVTIDQVALMLPNTLYNVINHFCEVDYNYLSIAQGAIPVALAKDIYPHFNYVSMSNPSNTMEIDTEFYTCMCWIESGKIVKVKYHFKESEW